MRMMLVVCWWRGGAHSEGWRRDGMMIVCGVVQVKRRSMMVWGYVLMEVIVLHEIVLNVRPKVLGLNEF